MKKNCCRVFSLIIFTFDTLYDQTIWGCRMFYTVVFKPFLKDVV